MKFLFYCFIIEFCHCACFAHFGSQKLFLSVCMFCALRSSKRTFCVPLGIVMPFPSSSVITGLRNVVFFCAAFISLAGVTCIFRAKGSRF